MSNVMSLDLYLFNLLHDLSGRSWPLDWVGVFFAEYAPYFLLIAALILGIKEKNQRRKIVYFSVLALSILLSRGVFTETIRYFYYQPRPYAALDFAPLVSHDSVGSFPSGHATFYFALAFGIFYFKRRAGIWFLSVAALMGIARIYAGVHWPLDIVSGAVIGAASVLVVVWLLKPNSLVDLKQTP